MATSTKYNRFAVRCLEEARHASDQSMRAFLIEMAQAWQLLANQASANENLQGNAAGREADRGD
jgi:hypothetical protein